MYSSEYTSGFSGPAASHLTAPDSSRHENNVGQAPGLLKSLAIRVQSNEISPTDQPIGT
jgi:hypothetical protein